MKLEADIDSITSMCTALILMHVKKTAQHLLSALPPPVRQVKMSHGPNTSRLTLVKGGSQVSLSTGRGAIFCSINLLSFLQVTQLYMMLDTSFLPPTIHTPADRMTPSVK